MASILSLEASIHVCGLPPKEDDSPIVRTDEQVYVTLRRLAFNIFSAYRPRKTVEEAKMSCASQISGIINGLSGVSQPLFMKLTLRFDVKRYISDSIYTCPPPNEVKNEYAAKCGPAFRGVSS